MSSCLADVFLDGLSFNMQILPKGKIDIGKLVLRVVVFFLSRIVCMCCIICGSVMTTSSFRKNILYKTCLSFQPQSVKDSLEWIYEHHSVANEIVFVVHLVDNVHTRLFFSRGPFPLFFPSQEPVS